MVAPFVAAASAGNRPACAALVQVRVHRMAALHAVALFALYFAAVNASVYCTCPDMWTDKHHIATPHTYMATMYLATHPPTAISTYPHAQAWPCYVECLRASNALDDGVLVDLTHTALDMLLLTREPPIAAEELGAATASGEQPHAQACVAMIVQTAVLEWLQEAGQRLLLKRVPGVLTQRVRCVDCGC